MGHQTITLSGLRLSGNPWVALISVLIFFFLLSLLLLLWAKIVMLSMKNSSIFFWTVYSFWLLEWDLDNFQFLFIYYYYYYSVNFPHITGLSRDMQKITRYAWINGYNWTRSQIPFMRIHLCQWVCMYSLEAGKMQCCPVFLSFNLGTQTLFGFWTLSMALKLTYLGLLLHFMKFFMWQGQCVFNLYTIYTILLYLYSDFSSSFFLVVWCL